MKKMSNSTKDKLKWASIRFTKVLVAVILAGLAAKYGDNQYYLLVAPLLVSIDKYLRS